jgi:hypothetical protein
MCVKESVASTHPAISVVLQYDLQCVMHTRSREVGYSHCEVQADFVGSAEAIKALFGLPYNRGARSIALHKCGNTLLLDYAWSGIEVCTWSALVSRPIMCCQDPDDNVTPRSSHGLALNPSMPGLLQDLAAVLESDRSPSTLTRV